jgi:hypothetical protein
MPPTFAALADSLLIYRFKKKPALVRFPFCLTPHLLLDWNEQWLTFARHYDARQLLPQQEHGNSSGKLKDALHIHGIMPKTMLMSLSRRTLPYIST